MALTSVRYGPLPYSYTGSGKSNRKLDSILGGLMGLFDEVIKGLTGKIFGQGVQNPLLDTVLNNQGSMAGLWDSASAKCSTQRLPP